jgi:hypothetical protein
MINKYDKKRLKKNPNKVFNGLWYYNWVMARCARQEYREHMNSIANHKNQRKITEFI